ncbi:hypothetical protein GDO81_027277, partial [Engystomops pustulosus]
VKPSMEVYSPEQFSEDSPPVLICHVWGFYPQKIFVAWIINDRTVVKNVSDAVRVGDWTYQVVVSLDLRGSDPGDNYTCVVEHESLEEPLMETWKAGLTTKQIIKISLASLIFVLGLVTMIAGIICWKNSKRSGKSVATRTQSPDLSLP